MNENFVFEDEHDDEDPLNFTIQPDEEDIDDMFYLPELQDNDQDRQRSLETIQENLDDVFALHSPELPQRHLGAIPRRPRPRVFSEEIPEQTRLVLIQFLFK